MISCKSETTIIVMVLSHMKSMTRKTVLELYFLLKRQRKKKHEDGHMDILLPYQMQKMGHILSGGQYIEIYQHHMQIIVINMKMRREP